jgi:hypothetical protein
VLAHRRRPSPPRTWRVVSPGLGAARLSRPLGAAAGKVRRGSGASAVREAGASRQCNARVVHLPQACEVVLSSFFGRRYFGIPESPTPSLYSSTCAPG